MLRNFLNSTKTLSKTNKRNISASKLLFNKEKKEGLDFYFGKEGEDNAHPNTKHYDLPEEEFGKYWKGIPSIYEQSVGVERAEIVDPFYFDELLPTFVDVSTGVGSTRETPIIVPTMGEKERVVACYGDCGNPEGQPEDFEDDFNYWVGEEGTFTYCLSCKLHFYFASNADIEKLQLDVQGRGIHFNARYHQNLIDVKEQLQNLVKKDSTTEVKQEEYETAIKYLENAKEKNLFNAEDIDKAKEYLTKYKQNGLPAPKADLQRLLDLFTAEEQLFRKQQQDHRKFIELHKLEYALPQE